MNKLLLVEDEGIERRFINPITESECSSLFVPDNCRIISPGDIPNKQLSKIPIVTDGLVPISFDASEVHIKYEADKRDSLIIVSTILLITGYCQRAIKNNDYLLVSRATILQEWLEFLLYEYKKYRTLLVNFIEKEKNRQDFFILTSEIENSIKDLNEAKGKISMILSDIRNILDKSQIEVLREIS